MRLRQTLKRGALALLAAIVAGGVGASTAAPAGDGWTADPEEQLLMDLAIRRVTLGDGVRAYPIPDNRVCVVLGDFLAALDVPMKIDLAQRSAEGWAFSEENRIRIDAAGGQVRFGRSGTSERLAPGVLREVPEGWCVESGALARWFGVGIEADPRSSAIRLTSEAKLPVELAAERLERAARIRPASLDLKAFPQVKLPYRLWRAPALDFVVSAGATWNAATGAKVDRQAAVYAAGEAASLSYDARFGTDSRGLPQTIRIRAYRSDFDGGLLGPLKATHFAAGDVSSLATPLVGGSVQGRGAMVTNRPLGQLGAFDKTDFIGELPAGWDAELYRNGALIAFARPDGDQRYRFSDVPLVYGENRFEILLHGPQGQVRRRSELVNVGQDSVPTGKTYYWAGAAEAGRDLIGLGSDPPQPIRGWVASAGAEHGLDKRTSVAALVHSLSIDDQRLTYVEGAVRRAVGPALVELSAARSSNGGTALRASMIGRIGAVSVNAESIVARDFVSHRLREGRVQDHRLTIDAPIKLGGDRVLPASVALRYAKDRDGQSLLEGRARLSTTMRSWVMTGEVDWRQFGAVRGGAPPAEVDFTLAGTGRVGDIRLRGLTRWSLAPSARFRTAEVSGYWSASDRADWEGALAWDGQGTKGRGRLRLGHVRRFDTLAVAVSAEAGTDGSLAAGVNLAFSLGPDLGRAFRLSSQRLASSGSLRARVFRDLDNDGVRGANEPIERDAVITAGTRVSEPALNRAGAARVDGLDGFRPVAIGVDATSLTDPGLIPRQAIQVIVPRPGVVAELDIPLVGAGDVEGAIIKSGGGAFEGLDLELVDSRAAVVATARSDYEGYFLFERVAYGRYRLRLAEPSAIAARVERALGAAIDVTPERTVTRLGNIAVQPVGASLAGAPAQRGGGSDTSVIVSPALGSGASR